MSKTQRLTHKKTILITGISGFLGSALAKHFLQSYRILGIVRNRSAVKKVRDTVGSRAVRLYTMSTMSLKALNAIDGQIDYVIHCAGGSSVTDSFQNPFKDYTDTVLTTMQILEYIRICHPRAEFIYPSSGAVYGNKRRNQFSVGDMPDPVSPYGYHKLQAESVCRMYHRLYGLRVKIIRFFSLYGPAMKKQIIWDAYRKLISADMTVTFRGTGEEQRDFLYIDDAVCLISKMISVPSDYLLVNGGTGIRTTVSRIISLIGQYLRTKKIIVFDGMKCDVFQTRADIHDLDAVCGWKPHILVKDGLQKTIHAYEKDSH